MPSRFAVLGTLIVCVAALPFVACAKGNEREAFVDEPTLPADGGSFSDVVPDTSVLPAAPPDPKTCEEAAAAATYIGCDYWPTVTSNVVASVFDFAVVAANVGAEDAHVSVTGNGVTKNVTVAPNGLAKIYLPWNSALKGDEGSGLSSSVLVRSGAYHLVSDKPVVVYQFNPLEFEATGGESGKDWSSCKKATGAAACYSYSNDASLLLPSTAMTGVYRVMGDYGFSQHPYNDATGAFDTSKPLEGIASAGLTITATNNNTTVTVMLGTKAAVVASVTSALDGGVSEAGAPDAGDGGASADDVPAAPAGGLITLKLDAGDVAQLVAPAGKSYDFSGTIVRGDHPVQVITSVPCIFHPIDTFACDHVEESVFPAETLGKHYVVTPPTGPHGSQVAHFVRIYGNVDGTQLTFKPAKPAGCPTSIDSGDVVDCESVVDAFEVTGTEAFGIGLFMLGGAVVDPGGSAAGYPQGDPSQSFAVAVEQYRQKYVFLAPTDYKTSFVDVIAGPDTQITIDGSDATAKLTQIAGTNFWVARSPLPSINDGAHTVVATRPIGIQVLGYGDNTSYQYPGGLNLAAIAPPPK
jgi:hypothetical protein